MARRNIARTKEALENRAETEQVYVDGDTTEAIFRALVDGDSVEEFEQFVDEDLDVDIARTKWVGFGVEVTAK